MPKAAKRQSDHYLWMEFNREIDRRWPTMKAEFVDAVHLRMLRDMSTSRFFAYYKPSVGTTWGELALISENEAAPDGFFPVTAQQIPCGTKEQIRHWFEPFTQRLPILPVWPR